MCPAIDNPSNCEICAVTRFLRARKWGAVDIHCELCAAVYSRDVMSEGTVKTMA
jgi:hypothetical protein